MALRLLSAGVIGYLLGSFPSGYVLGRLNGIDIRQWGSGATGGTNVLRTLGWKYAVTTGLLDLLKGTAGAYAGYLIAGDWGYAAGGFAALFGHSYSVWLGFKGGKSVATGAGALLLFHPWAFVIGLAAGLGVILPTRYVSLGSLVGALVLCGAVVSGGAPAAHLWLAAGALAVVYVRHWENMRRLCQGTENKFGQKGRPKFQS